MTPCRKRCYRLKQSAQAALDKMKAQVIDPFRLRIYWCDAHSAWHVGNKKFSRESRKILGKNGKR